MSVTFGERHYVIRDIAVSGITIFRKGDIVVVEAVVPNQERPQNRNVVYSGVTGKKYQLQDSDLSLATQRLADQRTPTVVAKGRKRRPKSKVFWAVVITVPVIAIAAVALILYFTVFGVNDDVMAPRDVVEAFSQAYCSGNYTEAEGYCSYGSDIIEEADSYRFEGFRSGSESYGDSLTSNEDDQTKCSVKCKSKMVSLADRMVESLGGLMRNRFQEPYKASPEWLESEVQLVKTDGQWKLDTVIWDLEYIEDMLNQ